MTQRLYYTSDATETTAQLLRCTPTQDGQYAVVLDRTLFHPQGGGQPADWGEIAGIAVTGVSTQGEAVIHQVARPIATGEVTLRIDKARRASCARLHSAGHLIGCAGERYGWLPVKAHHWPGEGRITFSPGDAASVPDPAALEETLACWQSQQLARYVEFRDGLRLVGFAGLPAYPCGGTHVANLGDIPPVVISGVKIKKGQLIIQYQVE
ncbi:alanyl-tRNA editing protein [Shimwellia pseudoproteus]|uniref:alanyl-tRNA editing protein n=1 Tax=Shimwellia pseudoproteus TaxID=570012 RepID=UPI0018EAF852|nr:alanyl-tRNA editing protein [Shimwellia pseudoproteus]MBJ3813494.1 alanyl-tRNA editing protein [Shimwellia pseudoproteus]